MKKGYLDLGMVFIIIGIITILILGFGVFQFTKIKKINQELRLADFLGNLNNNIKLNKQRHYGSVNEEAFILPSEITQICFIDRTSEPKLFFSSKLNKDTIKVSNDNVFFQPDTYSSYQLASIRLNKSENPLCVPVNNGRISLKFTNKGNFSEISSRINTLDKDCNSIIYNGNPEDKLDIVFLGYGYSSKDIFYEDISQYLNYVFRTTEPFSTNFDKINFYAVDKFEDFNCEIRSYVLCDDYLINKAASNCPNDYIIVLVDRNRVVDLAVPVRSTAFSNIATINTADNYLVLIHEFGHIFGRLADEYADDNYYTSDKFDEADYANCDDSRCNEWNTVPETGCFKECSRSVFYRATENSVMRELNTNDFGALNEKILGEKLNVYE